MWKEGVSSASSHCNDCFDEEGDQGSPGLSGLNEEEGDVVPSSNARVDSGDISGVISEPSS